MTLRVHPEVCIESNWGLTGHIFKVEKQGPVLWHKNHSRCLLIAHRGKDPEQDYASLNHFAIHPEHCKWIILVFKTLKTCPHTCTPILVTVLFLKNSQNVGTSRMSITGEWIHKAWRVHTEECRAIEREEMLVHGWTWDSYAERSESRKVTCWYDPVFMKCPAEAHLWRKKAYSWLPCAGVEVGTAEGDS